MICDTVAAVSTPRGKGGIAVIRISGDESAAVLRRCFRPAGKAPWDAPRLACYGTVVRGGEEIDTGLCTFFRSPASYTGEDSAEISCHGGTAVTAAVLEAVFAAGAVPAEAGEFTRRAFINGKLSLTEAEAVGRLIDADTDSRRRLANSAAGGRLKSAAEDICASLRGVLAALYAAIDYPDEDIGDEGEREIEGVLCAAGEKLKTLLSTYRTGSAVADGVVTAIAGAPNSGKSSLYNLLCRSDRAIVTDVAGTTRDAVTEVLMLGGLKLRLTDTAGIRETGDEIEAMGVEIAESAAARASLALCVFDGSQPLFPEDQRVMEAASQAGHVIAVLNKTDLPAVLTPSDLPFDLVVPLCAKTGEGIALLEQAVEICFPAGLPCDGAILTNARQAGAIDRAGASLSAAMDSMARRMTPDAVLVDVEDALEALGEITGQTMREEITNQIFSRFCVGK